MARRRYLVAYDISEPSRLRRICKLMESYGERLQYSVFICDLSIGEIAELETRVISTMDLADDSIVRIDLGHIDNPNVINFLGRARSLPHRGPHVI